jgi:hypothetical protein
MNEKTGTEVSGSTQKTTAKPASPAHKKLLLKIVLDTNLLYTGSASDLLQMPLQKLIGESSKHTDIQIEWHIPEVVRAEREYQMTNAASDLLPSIGKLERLLGHNLGISVDILSSRVRDAIGKQLKALGLTILPLDEKEINWQQVIDDAVFRRPPFEKGKTEKGFRDRLIAESFLQLAKKSSKTPSVCKVRRLPYFHAKSS